MVDINILILNIHFYIFGLLIQPNFFGLYLDKSDLRKGGSFVGLCFFQAVFHEVAENGERCFGSLNPRVV